MTNAPPVMILGCGRSGTSIFGELFDGLDRYTYRSEPPFEAVLTADYGTPQAFKVPRESDLHPAPPGLSFPLDRFLAAAPGARLFWIVRNPLDAVCSLRVGITKQWGHHPRPPDWKQWLARPLIAQCAHHWEFLNRTGYAEVEHRATLVRFEDMIADPAQFSAGICEKLGIDRDANAAHLAGWASRVQNSNTKDFVEARTSRGYSRPDHKVRVDRWRENLTDEEVDAIWAIVGTMALAMGYPAPVRNAR
ncbi:sulfotransferase [Sphingopyxis panaciterrae]